MTIPPNTAVLPSLLATHRLAKYWGTDSCSWRPARWISSWCGQGGNGATAPHKNLGERLDSEVLLQPPKGTYFPWAEGARYCPGKKFSLVEFTAVIARLFRTQAVTPLMEREENLEAANRRLLGLIEDSCQGLLIRVREPERAALVWKKRASSGLIQQDF